MVSINGLKDTSILAQSFNIQLILNWLTLECSHSIITQLGALHGVQRSILTLPLLWVIEVQVPHSKCPYWHLSRQ